MRVEIVCKGRRLRTDDGGIEYTHAPTEPIETFVGDVGDWSATGPNANAHIARLRGNQYQRRRDDGQHGRAEAKRRAGTATPDDLRLLQQQPERINYNLPCPSCPEKLTSSQDKMRAGLDRIAQAAKAGQLSIDNDVVTMTIAEVRAVVGAAC